MKPITPHLWFAEKADEAARFYVSLFPNSKMGRIVGSPSDSPSGPAGSVIVVDFTLNGQPFIAMTAGPYEPFNHAISFVVHCETQEEVDRYWSALLDGGGKEERCGWVKDRYGVSWQIVPTVLDEMFGDPDREKAKRATDAMLQMVKLDIAGLRRAFDGT
jgi:predicted 3-demethylubiquinone-9 3-methyltransferase (glyoxalase superfamily)